MYFAIFILGTIFWSFWSVLLNRLDWEVKRDTIKWILFWHSKCPKCNHRLKAKNLIPIVSFFVQNKKCEYCKKPIPRQYPILEISSGLIFVFSYFLVFNLRGFIIPLWRHITSYIFLAVSNWLFLLLIVQDIKKQELHMPIWILLTIWILIRQFFGVLWSYKWAFFASLIFAAIFLLIYLWAKLYMKIKYKSDQEWFGQWDIYLAFTLGAAIPFIEQFNKIAVSRQNHLKIIVSIIFIASILSIIYAIVASLSKKSIKIQVAKQSKTIVPFFPALIVVFWLMLVFANKILTYIF